MKYLIAVKEYSKWVCFEHEGFALDKARLWWIQHARALQIPYTVAEALDVAPTLPKLTRIKVKQEGKYWRVLDCDFKPRQLKSFMSQMRNEAMSVKPEEKERILSALKTLAAFVETMEVSQSCQSCLH